MLPAPFRVVLDANVLFPFTLRDTLLRAAEAGIYQLYWSEAILEEVRRNLVATGTTTEEQSARLITVMRAAFPEALVSGHESLIDSMPNDPKDRHVVAAAVKGGAQVIVTSNLRDFRELPDGLEAQSPDEFLCNLLDLEPDGIIARLKDQAAGMKRPAVTLEQLLVALAKTVPEFVDGVRRQARPPAADAELEGEPKPAKR
jgi:predicted nucleic acid-binding protein